MKKKILPQLKTYDLHIGIDTGVNTGMAVFDTKKQRLIHLQTTGIWSAIKTVLSYKRQGFSILVRIEDARQRRIGETKKQAFARMAKGDMRTTEQVTKSKAQGVGSVKRDAGIWEEVLKEESIDFELISPKYNVTKSVPLFEKITGIDAIKLLGKIKAEHAVDAAFLVIR